MLAAQDPRAQMPGLLSSGHLTAAGSWPIICPEWYGSGFSQGSEIATAGRDANVLKPTDDQTTIYDLKKCPEVPNSLQPLTSIRVVILYFVSQDSSLHDLKQAKKGFFQYLGGQNNTDLI